MIRFILLFISAIMVSGCSLIYEDPDTPGPVVAESTDTLTLSFQMYVPVDDAKSRTDNEGHEEIDSENPSLEDHIYSDDLCFFIYAGANGSEPAFIKKVWKGSEIEDSNTTISGGPYEYIIQVSIAKKLFNSIVPEGTGNVLFRVVAFANTNKEFENLTAEEYDTYSHLITAAKKWNFNIFGTMYSETEPGKLSESPRIPMYGAVDFSVSRELLYKSTVATPVWGEDISLLRSLAKVKVVDKITKFDAVYPYIESVTFNTKTVAYTLPENFVNGVQVKDARPYTENNLLKELPLLPNAEKTIWTGYVPEQVTKTTNGTDAPSFTINVALWKNDDGTEEIQSYNVPMTKYNDIEFNFGDYILRNHIYTLEVSMKATLNIEVVLAPYRSCVLDPFFGLDDKKQ